MDEIRSENSTGHNRSDEAAVIAGCGTDTHSSPGRLRQQWLQDCASNTGISRTRRL